MSDMRFNRPIMEWERRNESFPGDEKKKEEKTGGVKGRWQKIKDHKLLLFVILIIILLAGTTVFFYMKSRSLDQEAIAEREIEKTMAEVSKLIVLPEGEDPMVATVQDPEKLKDQPFFANAKEGYKVVIYTTARKAILYDPIRKIIVEVAPLNASDLAGQ